MGYGEGGDLQIPHLNGLAISGATQLVCLESPLLGLTGQLRALAAPNRFARSQAKLPRMANVIGVLVGDEEGIHVANFQVHEGQSRAQLGH